MRRSPRCPKCEGAMTEGFIIDLAHGAVRQATWQKGPPVKSFLYGIKQVRQDQLAVATYRCDRCGYLENYAV